MVSCEANRESGGGMEDALASGKLAFVKGANMTSETATSVIFHLFLVLTSYFRSGLYRLLLLRKQ